ncbi:protein kinase [Actinoplanes sp. GCM10030250]|uniref:protein kinase domain-containing protein n=1 Tax=Actinoplanes sp. GCM10030250 TaxID=3273376 RepID=UPI003616DE34
MAAPAVRDDGPLPPAEVARIGVRVLAALRAAHTAGVLHRDVKPDNVLLTGDGRVVLTDFGLATIGSTGGPDPRLGSPHYIAPERLGPGETGVPGDLWSLGATLYAAAEGRPPFGRGEPERSLEALLNEPPDPPILSGPLATLLLALLDKDPTRRPSGAETDARLRAVLRAEPFRGRAPVPAPRQRRAGVLLSAGALVVVVAGGAAVLATGDRAAAPPRFSAAPSASGSPGSAGLASASTLMSLDLDACGYGADAPPVERASGNVPAGLPRDWIWSRDPAGFSLALPAGWRRSTSGNDVCFTDPAGRRAFLVNVAAVSTSKPLDHWQRREKAERAAGDLPGYRRISMGVLLLKRGGADWEYTWRPDSTTVRHERRVLVAVTARTSYLLRWTVADSDWSANDRLQRRLVELFGSAR